MDELNYKELYEKSIIEINELKELYEKSIIEINKLKEHLKKYTALKEVKLFMKIINKKLMKKIKNIIKKYLLKK